MRATLIVTAAALVALATPAFPQSASDGGASLSHRSGDVNGGVENGGASNVQGGVSRNSSAGGDNNGGIGVDKSGSSGNSIGGKSNSNNGG